MLLITDLYQLYNTDVVVLHPGLTSFVILGWSVNLTTLFLGSFRPPKW